MTDTPNDPNDDPLRANRGIHVIVIALGAAIVIGVAALIYGILQKPGKPPETENAEILPAPPAAADTAIRAMMAVDGILYLHIHDGAGGEVVRAYDGNGRLMFEIDPTSSE